MRSHPEAQSIHIVKIGGENACRLAKNITTLDSLRENLGGKIIAIVSALRAPRGEEAFSATDRLVSGARTKTREAALGAIDDVANWTLTVQGIQEDRNLQNRVENWRIRCRGVVDAVFDADQKFETRFMRDGNESRDWRTSNGISLTSMGEELAVSLHTALGSTHEFRSGYRPDTADETGYSDQTAVRVALEEATQGHTVYLHIQKPSALMTADPRSNPNASFMPELWHDQLEGAFGQDGFASGVIQQKAYELLRDSGLAINVLIYNPNHPDQVTTVHFNQDQSDANVEALAA